MIYGVQILFIIAGVPRETEREKDVADFDIFDDPESPFSTFNFQYPNEAYTRLHDLMEFNTLNNLEVSSVPVILWQEEQKIAAVGTSVFIFTSQPYK